MTGTIDGEEVRIVKEMKEYTEAIGEKDYLKFVLPILQMTS